MQEGYIAAPPKGRQSRPFVAPLTQNDAVELFYIVAEMEGLAAWRAAGREDRQAVVDELNELNAEMLSEASVSKPSRERIFQLTTPGFTAATSRAAPGPGWWLSTTRSSRRPSATRVSTSTPCSTSSPSPSRSTRSSSTRSRPATPSLAQSSRADQLAQRRRASERGDRPRRRARELVRKAKRTRFGRASVAATILALLAPVAGAAQQGLAGLDDDVRRIMGDWEVPGVAVAVIQGDEVTYAKGFGVREIGGRTRSTRTRSSPWDPPPRPSPPPPWACSWTRGRSPGTTRSVDHLPTFQLSDRTSPATCACAT